MIRALIVDDEPLARRGVRVRLENEPDVEIIGEAEDGFAAIELIRAHRPDLVFLDVQMPGLDGFETLERVAAEHLPMVIFVTAHDAFALRAFEVHATDYLLKPFTEPRFAEALRRARVELSHELESLIVQIGLGTATGDPRARAIAQEALDELARMREQVAGGRAAMPATALIGRYRRPDIEMRRTSMSPPQ